MLNRMRFYLKIPSRKHRNKERPIKFTFIDYNDQQRTIEIPIAENPVGLLLPTFPPMGLFYSVKPPAIVLGTVTAIGHWRFGPPDEEAQALMLKHGAKSAFTDLDPTSLPGR